ncbi:DUF262 domain-containing protein [Sporosarcina sp. Marseille-Q4063]|uniref:DUF262 domain-containing protein n=1 Tax=Sporosarcina sp. Marseille-Q4063 TaxID=2810514 RepID=UPI001BAEC10E|nr:DUF262 domain-containing protein [Sporosarcina sp. Marseille-Q4063]QUW20485.1 DUF262 domain-containing protein [Sporosarcina sp. Marseille-Q4063]
MSSSKQFYSDGLVNIERLLNGQDFYEIPLLQRNFVWSKENIKDLIDDIKESIGEDLTQDYFIGSMVFSTGAENKVVVDGQQRITTLTLMFAVAVKRFQEAGETSHANLYLPYLYKDTQSEHDGSIITMNRLKHHDKDDHFFTKLINNKEDSSNITSTSQKNMLTAKEVIEEELSDMSMDELKAFILYLARRVHIVSMVTTDLNIAFRIFETLNDRGAKLQPEDLLKNMLLRNLTDESYSLVAKKWDDFISKLTTDKGKSIVATSTFLKHYIMSKGYLVQKSRLFEWIEKQTKLELDDPDNILGFNLKTNNGILTFINEIINEASLYTKVLSGNFEKSIDNCIKLGVKQTLVIVLASKDLKTEKQTLIYELMESLIFSYIITNSRFNELEKNLYRISRKLRKVNNDEGIVDSAIQDLRTMIIDKKDLALAALSDYKMKKSDRKKIKYILEKMGMALDGIDHSSFTIEHIMPEEKSVGWSHIKETDEDYNVLTSRIGNLTLISRSGNSSLKNKEFANKKQVYSNQTYLSKSIVNDIDTGTKNTKLDKAIMAYNYHPVNAGWNKNEIERRGQALKKLAAHIWFDI